MIPVWLTLLGCSRPVSDVPEASRGETRRIVSLGAGISEIVGELALGDVVAVDTSSLWPPELEDVPKVGYNRAISAEGILSLGPTLVLASDDTGPPAALDQLRASGVEVVQLPVARSVDDVRARIAELGRILHREEQARQLTVAVDASCDRLGKAGWTDRPRALFLYASAGGTLQVSGTGTAADAIFVLAGLENVVQGYEGYRPLTPEAAVQAAPDWLVLTDRGLEAAGGPEAVRSVPGLALTPAGRDGHVAHGDDLVLLAFGPRTCDGARGLGDQVRGR